MSIAVLATSPVERRAAPRMSAVNSWQLSQSLSFSSTSRYLVYCTINRGIKGVTVIPSRCRNEVHANHDRCPTSITAHCAA